MRSSRCAWSARPGGDCPPAPRRRSAAGQDSTPRVPSVSAWATRGRATLPRSPGEASAAARLAPGSGGALAGVGHARGRVGASRTVAIGARRCARGDGASPGRRVRRRAARWPAVGQPRDDASGLPARPRARATAACRPRRRNPPVDGHASVTVEPRRRHARRRGSERQDACARAASRRRRRGVRGSAATAVAEVDRCSVERRPSSPDGPRRNGRTADGRRSVAASSSDQARPRPTRRRRPRSGRCADAPNGPCAAIRQAGRSGRGCSAPARPDVAAGASGIVASPGRP